MPVFNVKAVKILEEPRTPKRWAGVVAINHGKYKVEDIDLKGQKLDSGEWYIEIQSDSIQDTVFARVNKDRAVGEKVQFRLDPQTKFAKQDNVEEQRGEKGRVVGTTWFEEHSEWAEGMFPPQ